MTGGAGSRGVAAVRRAGREDVGDLLTLSVVPDALRRTMDPFLLLAHHGPQTFPPGNAGLPFGPHPHRGFETVTFVRTGQLAHHDSGGHSSVIGDGGVQWMTAGSGLVHAEVSPPAFLRDGGPLEILQLWINLPAADKMTPPRYVGLQRPALPLVPVARGRGALTLVAGGFEGRKGPVETTTGVFLSVLELEAGASVELPAPPGRTVLLYVVEGDAAVAGEDASGGDLVMMRDDGDMVLIEARTGCAFIFGHAEPTGEPIVAAGPFVMNTAAEIEQAVADYRLGRFDGVPISIELG